jgi:hypothetical protein
VSEEEEKPFYNDFFKHKEIMIEQIKAGKNREDIIKSLREKYIVSKATATLILNLKAE